MINTWLDLVIPGIIIIGCFIMLACGIDGEVKSILGLAAGWAFRSSVKGVNYAKSKKQDPEL